MIIVLPDDVTTLKLPESAKVSGWIYGHGCGTYGLFQGTMWGVGKDLKMQQHTFQRGVAIDAEPSTATKLVEIAEYASSSSERIIFEQSIEKQLMLLVHQKLKIVEKPPSQKFKAWRLRANIPFGGDPLNAVERFSYWDRQLDEVAEWLIQEVIDLQGTGGLSIDFRSLGGHGTVLSAYLAANINRALHPTYKLRLLKIDNRVKMLKSILHLYDQNRRKDFSSLLIFHDDYPQFTKKTSDTILACCLLDLLKSQSPDVVTVINMLRERSPYVYMKPALIHIPGQQVKETRKTSLLNIFPIRSTTSVVLVRDPERLLESVKSSIYSFIDGMPENIGYAVIIVSGPFNRKPVDEMEIVLSNLPQSSKKYSIIVSRSGTISFQPHSTAIYATVMYSMEDGLLPPPIAEMISKEDLDQVEVHDDRYQSAIEKLSKLTGFEVRDLI